MLHFLDFNIMRICKFAKEAFNLILKDRWTFLDNILNIFKNDILCLSGCKRYNRDNRRSNFFN
jgi:hypothetical protein